MGKTKFPELQFEKRNKNLQKIPKNARVQKRPILHPPVASPYAGTWVPKVVYVSTKTPFMCAAKRVQKLLKLAEKRATSKVDLGNNKISEKGKLESVVQARESLEKEEVIIMATGRAIDKAMSLEKWFKDREEEYEVHVRTKSVLVVDDILPDSKNGRQKGPEEMTKNNNDSEVQNESLAEGGCEKSQGCSNDERALVENDQYAEGAKSTTAKSKSMRRKQRAKKKKKKILDSDEQLVSRTRYVNGVEIAVTLK